MTDSAALPVGMAGLQYPITQISLAVRDLDATMERYHRAFGWAPWQVFDHVPPVHHATMLRGEPVHYALRGAEVYVGSVNFELLQPLEGPNLWTEFMDRRGPGIASIATMFHERFDGDAVKAAFQERYGIPVTMKADIGDHIEYYYLDTEARFGCLIESGSGHAIDFVHPASVYPHQGAEPGRSPTTGLEYAIRSVTLLVRDLEPAVEAYREAFGWGPFSITIVSGGERSPEARVASALVGDTRFEIVEPLGDGAWRAVLERDGQGLAAIGLGLADGEAEDVARSALVDLGAAVIAEVGSAPGHGRPAWTLHDGRRDFACLIAIGNLPLDRTAPRPRSMLAT
jgi:glyoxalase/bleomycin resistance protein/dioxygenase superfamily protein